MNLISINGLSKRMGDRFLFQNVTLGINEGDRIALIGTNGSGKSTLLRIINGSEEPDSGEIVKRSALRIGFLEQNPPFLPDETVQEHILRGEGETLNLVRSYLEAEEKLKKDPRTDNQELHASLTEQMNRLSGWKLESDLRSIAAALGVNDLHTPMKNLSGGVRRKASLIKVLLSDYDLIILDEPTNHLDMSGIQKLESILSRSAKTILMVTHDRYFMERVTERILEIEEGEVRSYSGSYSKYLEDKAALEEAKQKSRADAKRFLKKELEWIRRQPKARGTKQKARIDRFETVKNSLQTKSDSSDTEFGVRGRRQGKKILDLIEIDRTIGDRNIINNFTHSFLPKDRIGIIGPNGCGKTTLLEIIAGRIRPEGGNIDRGVNTVIGYFDQTSRELDNDSRIIDYVKNEFGSVLEMADGSKMSATDLLEYFRFPASHQYLPIGKLSGGEKRRLYLAGILLANPNFLLLDEPTNDLDTGTLGLLEDFLESFPGCIVTVSHDRYFLDRVTNTQFVFTGNGEIEKFPGSCSDYLEYAEEKELREQKVKKSENSKKSSAEKKTSEKSRLSYMEKRELPDLEKEIDRLESEIRLMEEEMSSGSADYKRLEEVALRHNEAKKTLTEKMDRWEYLASFEK